METEKRINTRTEDCCCGSGRLQKHVITVCRATPWHKCEAYSVLMEFERILRIHAGESTQDGAYTLHTTKCPGACSHSPIVTLDGYRLAGITAQNLHAILHSIEEKQAIPQRPMHKGDND